MASTWRVNNSTALGGEVCAPWVANHAYSLGARVVCRQAYGTTARRQYVYECTTAGTSHGSTEPTWPTSGTVADGANLVWTCRTPNDGSWDNATCFLPYILNNGVAAGDTVLVHEAHAEANTNGNLSYVILGGTTAAPVRIYCVDKADDSLSTGAVVYQHSAGISVMFRQFGYSYGVQYKSDYDISFFDSTNGCGWILESANALVLSILTANRRIVFGAATGSASQNNLRILNGGVNLGAISNGFNVYCAQNFVWKGGSLTAAAGVTALISNLSLYGVKTAIIQDVDLSAIGAGATATSLVAVGGAPPYDILFERCKLTDAAGFSPTSGAWVTAMNGKVRLHHCSSANATYDFHENSYEGTVTDETTIVRTGGASDGTTPLSMKMVSSAGTLDGINGLESPPIHGWTESTTEKTFTIEVVHDSVTALQNDEIWMELMYPADSTSGLGALASSRCAPLSAAADIADSSEAWTTTGLTNPNTRKLSITVTPEKVGPITARVYLAKASTTVYIDPMITES